MQVWQYLVFPIALVFVTSLFVGTEAQAAGNSISQAYGEQEIDPLMELAWEVLRRGQSPMFRDRDSLQPLYKRGGLDLGISRGYSGSQAAKHLMGLASATYAGGPGRRRREAPTA